MQYKVINKLNKEIILSETELFSLLIEKAYKNSPSEKFLSNADDMTAKLFELLDSKVLTSANLNQLFTMYFLFGFYYSNFINKNDVNLIQNETVEE